MDEWHRERSLNVFGRTCVDVQDGLSGNPGGSPQPRNVHHHQSTASVPHPMHLPHTNGPRISPHHQAIVEAEAECNSQTIPSLGVSRLTMSVPVRDRGIAKFSPPSSGEFNARPPAPMEGLGILLNSKERFSPLVQQDVEYQAAAQAIDHRDSLSPSQCDGVLGPQRAQSTRSPRSQARLLPPGDAPPINGGLIRRQPLKLRKTCDACGKHKKVRRCWRDVSSKPFHEKYGPVLTLSSSYYRVVVLSVQVCAVFLLLPCAMLVVPEQTMMTLSFRRGSCLFVMGHIKLTCLM